MLVGVERSEELSLPCTLVVGSYGGGDAFRAAPQLLVVDLTPVGSGAAEAWAKLELPADGQEGDDRPLRQVVWDEVVREHARQMLAPPDERVARMPEALPSSSSPPVEVRWQLRFQVSEWLASVEHHNMFYQGWLFAEDVKEEGRLGIGRYPLVGLFHPTNLARPSGQDDPAHVGINCLRPADQHTHLLQETLDLDGFSFETKDWHVGSDMARFTVVDQGQPCCMTWAVCADLDTLRCEVSLLLLVRPDVARKVKQRWQERESQGPPDHALMIRQLVTALEEEGATQAVRSVKSLLLS